MGRAKNRKRKRSSQEIIGNPSQTIENTPAQEKMAAMTGVVNTELKMKESDMETEMSPGEKFWLAIQNMTSSLDLLHGKFDGMTKTVDKLTTEIYDKGGLEDRLTLIECEAGDATNTAAEAISTAKSMQTQVDILKAIVCKQEKQILELKEEVTDLKCRSMRENILLHNVPEQFQEDPTELISKYIQDTLKLDDSHIDIERAHRMGPKSRFGKPRPIVAKLSNSKHVQVILQAERKNALAETSDGKMKNQRAPKCTPQFPEEIQAK